MFTFVYVNALDVNSTSGNLSSVVTDLSITSLKVTGTVDARDFAFINEKLTKLQTLDLASTAVEEFQDHTSDGFVLNRAATVPRYAFFGNTHLVTVKFPASATTIGDGALAGCVKVSTVTLPTKLDSIGLAAFDYCEALTSVTFPATIRAIGEYAFAHSGLKTLTFKPASSSAVANSAFADCKQLTSVTLGKNITQIDENAFAGCEKMATVKLDTNSGLLSIGACAFERTAITSLDFLSATNVQTISDFAFANTSIVTAAVQSSVANIGDGLFFYNDRLQSAMLSSDKLPAFTFAGSKLVDLGTILTDKTTEIGEYAFYNNSKVAEFTVPADVNFIGTRAMAGMTGLKSIEAKPTLVPRLGDDVWEGVDQKAVTLVVAEDMVQAYSNELQWKEFYISSGVKGDVNLDGKVNVGDVGAIYSVILGLDLTHESRADVNLDNKINVADCASEYKIIMTGGSSNARNYLAKLGDSNDLLAANNVEIKSNEPAVVAFTLENENNYSAFQMDVHLPRGLKLTDVKLAGRSRGLNMGYNEITEGHYRIVAHAAEATLVAGSGAMLELSIADDGDFGGNDLIEVSDVLFVEEDVTCHYLEPLTIAASTTTGVKNINNDIEEGPVDVYNLQGQMLRRGVERSNATAGLPAGIYIVGGKKVIVE